MKGYEIFLISRASHGTGRTIDEGNSSPMTLQSRVRLSPPSAIGVIAVIALQLLGCTSADDRQEESSSKTNPPCLDWSADELQSAQAKITYAGEQTAPVLTVVFHKEGHKLSMERFHHVQHDLEVLYGNDAGPVIREFRVTTKEFSQVIKNVRQYLNEEILKRDSKGRIENILLFSIVRDNGGRVEGGEFGVTGRAGREFYKALLEALDVENEAGRRIITEQSIHGNLD